VPPKTQATAIQWPQWQHAKSRSISSSIVDHVREALFRGDVKPGDLLGSETDLACQFGTSRVPVRDAFKALQAQGIIKIKSGSNGGAIIASGDPNCLADSLAIQLKLLGINIEEMLEVQLAIEVMAIELAAKRATSAEIKGLRDIVTTLQAIAMPPFTPLAAKQFAETAMQFHIALIESARNRALSAQFKALRGLLEPVYARRTTEVIAERVIATDRMIINALEEKNVQQACSLVRHRLEIIRARQAVKAVGHR
jgi:GntR family transcriptional regulator, transcriptional repressor for pyruvate dehydrogenase complex